MAKKKNKSADTFTGLILGTGFAVFMILVTFSLLSFFDDGTTTPLNYDAAYESRIALGEIVLKLLAFGGLFVLIKALYFRFVNRINNTQLFQAVFVMVLFILPYIYYYYF